MPITGRIYLDLPWGAAQANATAANAGCGGGCMAYNASQTSVSSGCGGFDAYYARQYGLYPYNTNNGCGCGCGN